MAVTCRGIEDPSAGSNFLGKRVMGPFGGKRETTLFRHDFKDEQKSRLKEIVKPFVEAPAFAPMLKVGEYRISVGPGFVALLGQDTEFTPIEPWAKHNGELASGKLQRAWDQITGALWGAPTA